MCYSQALSLSKGQNDQALVVSFLIYKAGSQSLIDLKLNNIIRINIAA